MNFAAIASCRLRNLGGLGSGHIMSGKECLADARLEVIDPCRHSLQKEFQHEFAVAWAKYGPDLGKSRSEDNQRWRPQKPDPFVPESSETGYRAEPTAWRAEQDHFGVAINRSTSPPLGTSLKR